MIEETGRVLAVQDGFADVETIRTSTCTSCRARHGCGHHAIAQVSPANRMRMRATNSFTVEVGQKVTVGIPEDTLLQASLWMYMIPLLGLVGGAVVPSLWGGGSGIAVVLSLLGFGMGLLLARNKSNKEKDNLDYYPRILKVEAAQGDHVPLVFSS